MLLNSEAQRKEAIRKIFAQYSMMLSMFYSAQFSCSRVYLLYLQASFRFLSIQQLAHCCGNVALSNQTEYPLLLWYGICVQVHSLFETTKKHNTTWKYVNICYHYVNSSILVLKSHSSLYTYYSGQLSPTSVSFLSSYVPAMLSPGHLNWGSWQMPGECFYELNVIIPSNKCIRNCVNICCLTHLQLSIL